MRQNERLIVAACADTLFPPGGPIPVSGTEAGLVTYIAAYLRKLSRGRRLLIRLLFLFIELSPLVFGPRRTLFTRLQHDDRVRVFEQMAGSAMYLRHMAVLSLRTLMTMGYFACPEVAAAIIRRPPKEVTP